MTVKRGLLSTAAALAVSLLSGTAAVVAAPILPGHLVVTQVGDGVTAVSNNATAVSVLEMTTSGGLVQTIPMPTAAGGGNNPYTASGTQSEQHITLTTNGQYLTLGGYNAIPGTATPANTSTIGRIIARIPLATGLPDTSTSLTDFGTGANNNLRSVVSVDGVQFYATTANAGIRYVNGTGPGVTTSVQLNNLNSRNANIFAGQLYDSSSSGTNTFKGVNTVGTGLPTTAGQTMARLPGMADGVSASSWDFFFADANTMYVVDDGASSATGGLQKWKFDGTNWSQAYRIATDGTVSFGLRSIAGYVDGSGNAVLFATNNQTTSRLLTMTDPIANTTPAAGQVWTGIYTAAANTQIRGVEFIPIPEPGSVALLIGAGATLLVRRGRKQ
ncbi:MAG: hypothetical protein QOF78_1896 [Phycisphaerales bacterium]|jgi:hypothetical protein|nr:hypothetical protein [Phycisphaerales bacterium]